MLINLVISWMLTFPFGNVPFTAQQTTSGTVVVDLPMGIRLEVLDQEMNYQVLEAPESECSSPNMRET